MGVAVAEAVVVDTLGTGGAFGGAVPGEGGVGGVEEQVAMAVVDV